jgi:hypothetical protein
MYWSRAKGIKILPFLDDLFSFVMGHETDCLLAKIVDEDMRRAGLTINWDMSDVTHKHERLHLGFDVDLAAVCLMSLS